MQIVPMAGWRLQRAILDCLMAGLAMGVDKTSCRHPTSDWVGSLKFGRKKVLSFTESHTPVSLMCQFFMHREALCEALSSICNGTALTEIHHLSAN